MADDLVLSAPSRSPASLTKLPFELQQLILSYFLVETLPIVDPCHREGCSGKGGCGNLNHFGMSSAEGGRRHVFKKVTEKAAGCLGRISSFQTTISLIGTKETNTSMILNKTTEKLSLHLAILGTCKSLYSVGHEIIYSRNTFLFTNTKAFRCFTRNYPTSFRSIRHMTWYIPVCRIDNNAPERNLLQPIFSSTPPWPPPSSGVPVLKSLKLQLQDLRLITIMHRDEHDIRSTNLNSTSSILIALLASAPIDVLNLTSSLRTISQIMTGWEVEDLSTSGFAKLNQAVVEEIVQALQSPQIPGPTVAVRMQRIYEILKDIMKHIYETVKVRTKRTFSWLLSKQRYIFSFTRGL